MIFATPSRRTQGDSECVGYTPFSICISPTISNISKVFPIRLLCYLVPSVQRCPPFRVLSGRFSDCLPANDPHEQSSHFAKLMSSDRRPLTSRSISPILVRLLAADGHEAAAVPRRHLGNDLPRHFGTPTRASGADQPGGSAQARRNHQQGSGERPQPSLSARRGYANGFAAFEA